MPSFIKFKSSTILKRVNKSKYFLSHLNKLTFQLCLLIFLLVFSSYTTLAQPAQPNMVVIMADDLGYYDIGFNRIHRPDVQEYGIIPTPNIDRIAQSGVTFTRGYAAHPFCGPSRAALLTGRYPHEVGSQYNLQNDAVDCNGQDIGIPIGPDSEFFSKVLQQQGNYNTYMVGKWHVGDAQQYDPMSRGFDEYYGFLGGGHQYFPEGDSSQGINSSNAIAANNNNAGINDYYKYLEKNRQWITDESRYVTRAISEEAVNFIKQGKQSNQPFMAYVAYNAPHTPLQAPLPDINQFKIDNPTFLSDIQNSPDILNAKNVVEAPTAADRQIEIDKLVEDRLIYATMVAIMDEGVGQILDELQSSNNGGSVYDNTVVIFLSDNGGKLREGGGANYPLDQGKGSVNEGGFRIPFCLSWPNGGIQPNTTRDHLVSSLDIYPTLLGAANLPVPSRLDGENLVNDLATDTPTLRNDPLYILRHFNGFSNVSIFDNIPGSNNKLMKKANASWKHYDVDTDIAEANYINTTASTDLINRLVPRVRILAQQHIQPLFFDNCGNLPAYWYGENMPRFEDSSNRPNTPDETFFLNCYANLQDSDNDGVCNELDLCAGNDDTIDANANGIPDACDVCDNSLIGTSCDDGNNCTIGETYNSNCNCVGGVFADNDSDGVCDANDICAGGDDTIDNNNNGTPDFCDTCNPNTNVANVALTGTASMSSVYNNLDASRLNDGNTSDSGPAHTGNSSLYEWAEIDLGTSQNINQVVIWKRTTCCINRLNNVYVLVSQTPFPSNTDLTAALANANFSLQLGDVSQQSEVAVNIGQNGRYVRLQKSGNNNNDNVLNLKELQVFVGWATSCDDGDACTTGDALDANCNCVGAFADADNDGVCDSNDICPGGNDNFDVDADGIPDYCDSCNNITGTSCDDGDPCTTSGTYDPNCNCIGGVFQDADNDGVCDANDVCQAGDDNMDLNMDGVPDACYVCLNTIVDTNNPNILYDREANVSISTNGKVLNGATVDYHAGQIVEFLNEFEVEVGAEFEAYIASCN